MKKEDLYKLWAYESELKMWRSMKEDMPQQFRGKMEELINREIEDSEKIYQYMLTIENPYYRQLIYHRCIKKKTWKEVAKQVGGSPESHRKAFSRFLDKM